MDIPQLITTLGVCGLVCYAVWWALQRAKAMPKAQSSPDALATFNALVESLKAAGKMDDAVQASVIAIREAVAEICMPLETDGDA